MNNNRHIAGKKRLGQYSAGTTLIELITAITIAALLTTLLFASYVAVQRGFRAHTRKAQAVQEMARAKAAIDRALLSVQSVIDIRAEHTLVYTDSSGENEHILSFGNASLLVDGAVVLGGLHTFEIAAHSFSNNEQSQQLLLWNALTHAGGWIGGARVIAKGEQ